MCLRFRISFHFRVSTLLNNQTEIQQPPHKVPFLTDLPLSLIEHLIIVSGHVASCILTLSPSCI